MADAYSTVVFTMPLAEGMEFVNQLDGVGQCGFWKTEAFSIRMDLKNTPGDDKVFLIRRRNMCKLIKRNKEERESQMKKIFQMKEQSQKEAGVKDGKSYIQK